MKLVFATNNPNKLSELQDLVPEGIEILSLAAINCNEELPEITKLYDKWKLNGVEVVFVALEEDKKSFMDFAKTFPFPSYSDNKKWESNIVKDYYVFSTPTMFLLDNKREIILRPNSVKQMDAWVDWNLK